MSRYLPQVPLFAFLALAPLALSVVACDALHKDKEDAAPPAVVAPVVPVVAAPVAPDPNAAPPVTGAAAPLNGAVPTPATPGHPVAVTDGGKVAPAADGGKVAPAATPTFVIPTAIPGFDAGAFKPPAGFPTAIPTTFPDHPAAPLTADVTLPSARKYMGDFFGLCGLRRILPAGS